MRYLLQIEVFTAKLGGILSHYPANSGQIKADVFTLPFGQGDHMIVSVFIRRLKPGASFQDFVREWEADEGFGVPTRVFNAQSLTDSRDIISIGFIDVGVDQLRQWLSAGSASEAVRHERTDTVIESTTLRCMYELHTEHDFSRLPQQIGIGSPASLLAALSSG
jgi:hypothetical protein